LNLLFSLDSVQRKMQHRDFSVQGKMHRRDLSVVEPTRPLSFLPLPFLPLSLRALLTKDSAYNIQQHYYS